MSSAFGLGPSSPRLLRRHYAVVSYTSSALGRDHGYGLDLSLPPVFGEESYCLGPHGLGDATQYPPCHDSLTSEEAARRAHRCPRSPYNLLGCGPSHVDHSLLVLKDRQLEREDWLRAYLAALYRFSQISDQYYAHMNGCLKQNESARVHVLLEGRSAAEEAAESESLARQAMELILERPILSSRGACAAEPDLSRFGRMLVTLCDGAFSIETFRRNCAATGRRNLCRAAARISSSRPLMAGGAIDGIALLQQRCLFPRQDAPPGWSACRRRCQILVALRNQLRPEGWWSPELPESPWGAMTPSERLRLWTEHLERDTSRPTSEWSSGVVGGTHPIGSGRGSRHYRSAGLRDYLMAADRVGYQPDSGALFQVPARPY